MGESAPNVIADGVGEALRCLRCGYDLRGFAAARCSECGWEIDRDLLSGGGFPWERRRIEGKFRCYVKTVWQVSIDSRKLRDAAERRHALADAKAFARVTAAIMALALIGLLFVMIRNDVVWGLFIQPQVPGPTQEPRPVWLENLGVPWSAGMTMLLIPLGMFLPVPALLLAALAFYVTRAPRRLFRARLEDAIKAESAEAIACYTTAPLLWLVLVGIGAATLWAVDTPHVQDALVGWFVMAAVAAGVLGLVVRMKHAVMKTQSQFWFMPAMLFLAVILCGIALLLTMLNDLELTPRNGWRLVLALTAEMVLVLTIYRVAQWARRVKKMSLGGAFLCAIQLIGIWLWGVIVLLGAVPWCIGWVWIVIDSFL